MSDTILAADLTVFYLDENRRKQIRWTGGTLKTDVQKFIDIYSATEDLFTVPTQQNDGLIFSAETPGEYTIGLIDAGELEPWFIDLETMEHVIGDFANFTGCALKTSGWKRVLPGDGTENIGIVVVPVDSGGNIVKGDIGQDITHFDGDAGTLLDVVITGGATDYLFIRPDTNLLADDWNSSANAVTEAGASHTADQNAAAVTGEMIWGNVFSQGALVTDTHLYVLQDGVKITSHDAVAEDWWPDGHIDRAIPITDYTATDFPLLDLGFLTVKADKYGSKYTNAVIRMNSTSGGNVSAGLSSGDDATNVTGYNAVIFNGAGFAAGWSVGDEMVGTTSLARGIITQIDSPGASQTVHYYLVGDPLNQFDSGGEAVTNADDTGTGNTTVAAPSLEGPALTTWFDGNSIPTYAFANTQVDIDDDGNPEEYGITIDLLGASLAQMHEANKFTHRRGSALDQDGIEGEQWIGIDYAINYASITGVVGEGSLVTGQTSGATGIVVSNPAGTTNTALLRNSRGTFVDGEDISLTPASHEFDAAGLTVEVIVPVAEASFGTLAGTSFFFSRGVVPVNYKVAEENLFSVITADGVTKARPTSITMTILNLLQFDYASCFRLLSEGNPINKTEYSATGGETTAGATLTVDGTIAADVAGKTLGGFLVLQDVSDDNQEYVIRFDSFVAATGVVTLSASNIAAATSASPTNIQQAGAFASSVVGDLVFNNGNGHDGVSYISEVVGTGEVNIDPPIASQTTGDNIDLNSIPIALVDTADNVYFLIVFEFKESDGTASASMQYVGDIFGRVVVRNTAAATIKIKGFTAAVTIGTGGGSSSATRIPNTVYA
jgi:hypothetical protein